MEIGQLLKFAVEKDASDILLTAGTPPAVRIDGELIFTNVPPLTSEGCKAMIYGVLENHQIAAFEEEKELDFSFHVKDVHRFRGNVYLQRGCVAATLRLIPSDIPTLEELHLPPSLEDFALRHQGLVLVTGPAGHGKSTTLASMTEIINQKRKAHIVAVEDPIEFVYTNKKSVIDQREVGDDTRSFAGALEHVLRQSPDVIVIGEMRDLETISSALTAAETGHLVMATLHTNDAAQSVDRLIDVFPPHQQGQVRTQLAFCLLAVIAQRLLPRADGNGRIVATEIMLNNSAVAHLIREGKTHNIYSVMETHSKDGMYVMDASIKQLCAEGLITHDEAKRRMKHPNTLPSAGQPLAPAQPSAPVGVTNVGSYHTEEDKKQGVKVVRVV